MDDVKEAIRDHILARYLPGETRENLPDDLPLLTSGILDSLAALGLAEFIQARFGIELDVYDTMAERFDCIDDIVASVDRKRRLSTRPASDSRLSEPQG